MRVALSVAAGIDERALRCGRGGSASVDGVYLVTTTWLFSSRFSTMRSPSRMGIVDPASVPKPTVTTEMPAFPARSAAATISW